MTIFEKSDIYNIKLFIQKINKSVEKAIPLGQVYKTTSVNRD